MKILLAYNASPAAEAALDEIIRRPWPSGSEVRLVSVVEMPAHYPIADGHALYAPLFEEVVGSLRADAHKQVQRALARLKDRADLKTSSEIRDDEGAKYALLEAIRSWKPDLVIAGSDGTSMLGRVFLGSVALALAAHAPCSVEIVKTAGAR